MNYVPYRRAPAAGFRIWLPPIAVTGALWWYSSNAISPREGLLAAILLFVPCYSYSRWQSRGRTRIPMFAILALAYWAAFAMPLFLSMPPADPLTQDRFSETQVFGVLEMAVIGVLALGVGMKVPLLPVDPGAMPDVTESPAAWRYLYCVMAFGIALSLHDWSGFNSGALQFILALSNIVPVAICAILAVRRIEGVATASQRYALVAFVAARIVTGIASGWLQPTIFMGIILALVYISKCRRLPVGTIAIILPVILFFQAGKMSFRGVYWTQSKAGGVFEKASFWLEASFREWKFAFTHPGHDEVRRLFGESIDRIALLNQSVNVLVKTPRVVPYQEGKTYSFLVATLIPRLVWPQKPSVSEANQFYQVAYGVTQKENLDTVSISVGCLAESFMNFGWWGVVPVMFLLGLLLGWFERILLGRESGLLFYGIGLGLLSTLLAVECQASQYLGGLLQQIAVVFVVVLPVVRRRKVGRDQLFRLQEAV